MLNINGAFRSWQRSVYCISNRLMNITASRFNGFVVYGLSHIAFSPQFFSALSELIELVKYELRYNPRQAACELMTSGLLSHTPLYELLSECLIESIQPPQLT